MKYPSRKYPSKAAIAVFCVAGAMIAACRPAAETVERPETVEQSETAAAETKTLRAFADEKEMRGVLDKFREAGKKRRARSQAVMESGDAVAMSAPAAEAAADAAAAPAEASKAEAPADEESITNVQTAGVDEGGIVKRQGDFLIVLRRGRLFTLRIGDDDLRPVSSVDAYGPGIDPNGAWYDEMLVSDKTVVVIGYSYQRGGTEVGLFDLDGNGGLNYRATYHLRSNDYYSSRNYASRMIGDKLV
nr:beta-propeller domain-containing protein [Xanthomonadaceae bacterium]